MIKIKGGRGIGKNKEGKKLIKIKEEGIGKNKEGKELIKIKEEGGIDKNKVNIATITDKNKKEEELINIRKGRN